MAMGRTSPPEDGRPTPPTPWELRCLDSFSPEKRRLADSLETHRGPWPWVGHHPLKTAGPHPQAPGSCAAPKSVPLHGGLRCRDWISTEKRRLADPLETHRGPWPWVGHHPLKTAGPHPQSTASRGLGVWACRLQGVMPYPWPRSPVSFERIGQPSFFRGK